MPEETKREFTKVSPLPIPPRDFDPLSADRETLAHFGFPRRPDREKAPHAYSRWKRLLAGSMKRIEPIFIFPKRPIYPSQPALLNSLPAWAGAVQQALCVEVVGEWTLPNVSAPAGEPAGLSYLMSSWVGLGGWVPPAYSLLQAGVSQGINLPEGSGTPFTTGMAPWTEWYPNNAVWLDFPVTVGDVLTVWVATQPTPAGGVAWFFNSTQGASTGFSITVPYLTASSAEWIVECPGNETFALPDFGTVTFQQTGAEDAAGSYDLNASGGIPLTMQDRFDDIMASPEIDGETVTITWEYTGQGI